jgi:hypothetical protein
MVDFESKEIADIHISIATYVSKAIRILKFTFFRMKIDHNRSVLQFVQGDQIGQNFVHWAIVFSGPFLLTYKRFPNCWANIFDKYSYVIVLAKIGIDFILGDFSHTNLVTPNLPLAVDFSWPMFVIQSTNALDKSLFLFSQPRGL